MGTHDLRNQEGPGNLTGVQQVAANLPPSATLASMAEQAKATIENMHARFLALRAEAVTFREKACDADAKANEIAKVLRSMGLVPVKRGPRVKKGEVAK